MINMESIRKYTDFNEFVKNEPELVKSIIEMINSNDEDCGATELSFWNWREEKYEPMTHLSDIVGLVQNCGYCEEDIDSLYVNRFYTMETDDGKFTLEVYGSSYRKDQIICDEEMEEEVVVTDNEMFKIEAEQEKAIKKEKSKIANTKKWQDFITESQKVYVDADEILNELMNNYKFPSKI